MTTVAYRDGVLAADTQVCDNHARVGHTSKIARLQDGSLIGASGSMSNWGAFKAWAEAGFPADRKPEMTDTPFDGIRVLPDGEVVFYNAKGVGFPCRAPFHATGSGMKVALGAMWMGATAEQAVRCAVELDAYTGGEVETLRLSRAPTAKWWPSGLPQ